MGNVFGSPAPAYQSPVNLCPDCNRNICECETYRPARYLYQPLHPCTVRRPGHAMQLPCHFFAGGHCRNGDRCSFSHDKQAHRSENQEIIVDKTEEHVEGWIRELGAAWIQFGDGAAVTKVSLPSDFSAIHLSNLPPNSSRRSVMTLFSDVGLTVLPDHIRIIKPKDQTNASAVVRAEDPNFASTACSKLRTCITIRNLNVTPIRVPLPEGSGFSKVECKRVHCSWHKPVRAAFLSYERREDASNVQRLYRSGRYKVLGIKVPAYAPCEQSNYEGKSLWMVKLTTLPEDVKDTDIWNILHGLHKPQAITLGDPSYEFDAELHLTIIKSLLYQFGPLEKWEVNSYLNGRRFKVYGTFFEDSHAQAAAIGLNNIELPFCESNRLFVQLVPSVSFKVSTRVYDVVQQRLEAQKGIWQKQFIRYFASPSRGAYRVLKLEGVDKHRVAQAQKTLEKIIHGQVMRFDGNDIWNSEVKLKGDDLNRLRKIEQDLDVVITRDIRTAQFRVFGSEQSYERAAKALHGLILEVSSQKHHIYLNDAEFEWAFNRGFTVLSAELGSGKAAFDVRSGLITLHGPETALARAKLIMARRQTQVIPKAKTSEADCAVCWNEAESPVKLTCGHVYCDGCFIGMCDAEASKSAPFCVTCCGNRNQCGKIVPLLELHNLLLSEKFEDILGASFTSYVRQHPAEFRFCPTADCSQIYRTSANSGSRPAGSTITCTRCFTCICTVCHNTHPGQACAEYKGNVAEDAAFEETKDKLGIKDCPKCTTMLEKSDGCNHMTCTGCGAHICWKCLTPFKSNNECYAHLRKVHGGYFDGDAAAM